MDKIDKKRLGEILEETATLLDLKGENVFKVRAYHNASRIISGLTESLDEMVESGEIKNLKGIGETLAEQIDVLVRTGGLPFYEELKRSFPPGMLEMLDIPGLGPKKVRALHEALGVTTVGELEYACQENRLLSLEGFGEKSQRKVLEGIARWHRYQGRYLINEARRTAEPIVNFLKDLAEVEGVALAGSLRRCRETVKDIDLVAATASPEQVMEAFVAMDGCAEVIAHGETKSSILLESGLPVDLRCVSSEQFPFALAHFTGSKDHNAALRSRAKKRGWKLNEYGLFDGETLLPCTSEEQIYERLGLAFIPPELRENRGEVETGTEGALPQLIEEEDLRGTFHVHTTASDGRASLDELVCSARRQGWSYLGICDHSRSAHYANGLEVAAVREQWRRIEGLNAANEDFRLFKGIESDILADGSLDYPEEVLEGFDFVIASVHSRFGLSRGEQTARLLAAIENPYTTMIGHLSGRLLLARDGYEFDSEAVIAAAAANGVILELNANPHRLDLDWRLLRQARDAGVMIAINPDAHSAEGLQDTRYGVGIARKGWLRCRDVLNTRTAEEVADWLETRKAKR